MFLGFFDEGAGGTVILPLTAADGTPLALDAAPTLSLLGADGPIPGTAAGDPVMAGPVSAVSTAGRVTSAAHGLQTGQAVTLAGTATRDGTYLATVIDADTFDLAGATAGSAQASPAGTWQLAGVWKFDLPSGAVPSLGAGSTYTVVVNYTVSAVAGVAVFNLYVQ